MIENDNSSSRQFEIGRALGRARERQGLSLGEVEQATKIRARYLEELEHGNFDVLPPVYARGSLKTYANYLGLDAGALVSQLPSGQDAHSEDLSPGGGGLVTREEGSLWEGSSGAGIGAAVNGDATDEEVGGRADEVETGVRSWLPGGDELRSYVGMVALVVVVLPVVVLALTLVDRDLAPTPVQAPVADSEANGRSGGDAGNEAEGQRDRPADQARKEDDRASARDEGDNRLPEQGDERGARGPDAERAGPAAGAVSQPATASPTAAIGAAPVPAASVPPASVPPASVPAVPTAPAAAAPATAAPAAAAPVVTPGSTASPAAPGTGSTASQPTETQPATEQGVADGGIDPIGYSGVPETGVSTADSGSVPAIPDVAGDVYPGLQPARP